MKKSRNTVSQIMDALKHVALGLSVPDPYLTLGSISPRITNGHPSKAVYWYLKMARMKVQEEENRRLKT
jgi:hypothetical protein